MLKSLLLCLVFHHQALLNPSKMMHRNLLLSLVCHQLRKKPSGHVSQGREDLGCHLTGNLDFLLISVAFLRHHLALIVKTQMEASVRSVLAKLLEALNPSRSKNQIQGQT